MQSAALKLPEDPLDRDAPASRLVEKCQVPGKINGGTPPAEAAKP